jgi:hypothetical protein
MELDQSRKRTQPARLEDARQQRRFAVAEVFDVADVEFGGAGFNGGGTHGILSFGLAEGRKS